MAATLVLLPGLDGTDVFLRPLVAALSPRIETVVVGYPESVTTYAASLDVVRRATAGLSRFHVLGLSYSGPVAVMLAAEEPTRVRSVVLAATFVRAPRPLLKRLRLVCTASTLWAWRIARRVPVWLFESRDAPVRRAKAETLRRVPARTFAARVRAVVDVDVRALLRRCRQPILSISFEHDTLVPRRNVDDIVREVPLAKIVAVPGGHTSACLHSEVLTAEVEKFVAAVESADAASDHGLSSSPTVRPTNPATSK